MLIRISILLLVLGVLLLGALIPAAISQGDAKPELESSTTKSDVLPLKTLVETASIIVIAEVQAAPPSSEARDAEQPRDSQIDIQKELDKAREETARTFEGLNVGPLVRLNTIEVLKGPQTQTLSVPRMDQDLIKAAPGDLFLIMMGSNHPDAIRSISSTNDPWVGQVKAALAN